MCSIGLRNCLSLTSSFLLKSHYKPSSRASVCHPNLCFRLSSMGVRGDGFVIATRISQYVTPMMGEHLFFDEIPITTWCSFFSASLKSFLAPFDPLPLRYARSGFVPSSIFAQHNLFLKPIWDQKRHRRGFETGKLKSVGS